MDLVIDCSGLELETLRSFLQRSRRNRAVLCDVTAHEVFRPGLAAVNRHRILADFPGQVLVLRSMGEIAGLRPRTKGLLGRLVDKDETAAFPRYATALVAGHSGLINHLPAKSDRASQYLDGLLPVAAQMHDELLAMIRGWDKGDLAALRAHQRVEAGVLRNIAPMVGRWTKRAFEHLGFGRVPTVERVKYAYPFRLAVCQAALTIDWAAKGGLEQRGLFKVRNDMTDCAVAAYATLFDGLLEHDRRLSDVHRLARQLLIGAFKVPIAEGFQVARE